MIKPLKFTNLSIPDQSGMVSLSSVIIQNEEFANLSTDDASIYTSGLLSGTEYATLVTLDLSDYISGSDTTIKQISLKFNCSLYGSEPLKKVKVYQLSSLSLDNPKLVGELYHENSFMDTFKAIISNIDISSNNIYRFLIRNSTTISNSHLSFYPNDFSLEVLLDVNNQLINNDSSFQYKDIDFVFNPDTKSHYLYVNNLSDKTNLSLLLYQNNNSLTHEFSTDYSLTESQGVITITHNSKTMTFRKLLTSDSKYYDTSGSGMFIIKTNQEYKLTDERKVEYIFSNNHLTKINYLFTTPISKTYLYNDDNKLSSITDSREQLPINITYESSKIIVGESEIITSANSYTINTINSKYIIVLSDRLEVYENDLNNLCFELDLSSDTIYNHTTLYPEKYVYTVNDNTSCVFKKYAYFDNEYNLLLEQITYYDLTGRLSQSYEIVSGKEIGRQSLYFNNEKTNITSFSSGELIKEFSLNNELNPTINLLTTSMIKSENIAIENDKDYVITLKVDSNNLTNGNVLTDGLKLEVFSSDNDSIEKKMLQINTLNKLMFHSNCTEVYFKVIADGVLGSLTFSQMQLSRANTVTSKGYLNIVCSDESYTCMNNVYYEIPEVTKITYIQNNELVTRYDCLMTLNDYISLLKETNGMWINDKTTYLDGISDIKFYYDESSFFERANINAVYEIVTNNTEKVVIEYKYQNHNSIKTTQKEKDGNIYKAIHTYGLSDQLLQEKYYKNNSLKTTIAYNYDTYLNQVSKTIDGVVSGSVKEYDAYGNCIKETINNKDVLSEYEENLLKKVSLPFNNEEINHEYLYNQKKDLILYKVDNINNNIGYSSNRLVTSMNTNNLSNYSFSYNKDILEQVSKDNEVYQTLRVDNYYRNSNNKIRIEKSLKYLDETTEIINRYDKYNRLVYKYLKNGTSLTPLFTYVYGQSGSDTSLITNDDNNTLLETSIDVLLKVINHQDQTIKEFEYDELDRLVGSEDFVINYNEEGVISEVVDGNYEEVYTSKLDDYGNKYVDLTYKLNDEVLLSTTSSKVVNISQAKVTNKKQITVSNNSNFINYSKEVTNHTPFNVVSDFKYKDKTYQIVYDDLKLNITRITDGVNIQTFEYDKFNQLIKETKTNTSTNTTISTEYAYDQLGNMTSRVKKSGSTVIETNTFSYSNNQLSSQTKNNVLNTISTNARGNIVEFTNNSGNSLSCEYNKLNQLIKVTIQSQNSSRALLPPLVPLVTEYIEFKYDESGRRKEKYHYKNDTYYLDTERITYRYINGLLVEEVRNIKFENIRNDALHPIEPEENSIERVRYLYSENEVIGYVMNENEIYIYEKNVFGDIIGIVNESNEQVARYSYNGYGECNIEYNQVTIGSRNPFRYRGYYYDEETNLFLVSSRYYSPELCRWISPDSIEYLDPESVNGLNLYCYCLNNPIMYVDPDGHMPLLVIALIAGGIAAGANMFCQMVFEDRAFNEIVWSEVIISGVSGFVGGLVPGSSFLSLVGQSAMSALVENGLRSMWYGEDFSMGKVLKETIISVAIGTAGDVISSGVNKLTSKITNKLFIKAPNYSQYQHFFRSKGFNYTREEVYEQMYKNVGRMSLTNTIVDKTTGYLLDFAGELF